MIKSDIIIIGAGPGGYETALLAAGRGKTVTLIEAGPVGGTCLNEGCIPTKSLCRSAEVLEEMKTAKTFGVSPGEYSFDFSVRENIRLTSGPRCPARRLSWPSCAAAWRPCCRTS